MYTDELLGLLRFVERVNEWSGKYESVNVESELN